MKGKSIVSFGIVVLILSFYQSVKLDESIKHDASALVNQGEMNKSQESVINNEPIRPDRSESKEDSKKTEVAKTTSVPNAPIKAVTMVATAYCGVTDKSRKKLRKMNGTGITKSGQRAKIGGVAADLDHYPIGTILYVPKFRRSFVVNDSGGKINGKKRIDIFMGWGRGAYEEAMEFGKQKLEVWVIRLAQK